MNTITKDYFNQEYTSLEKGSGDPTIKSLPNFSPNSPSKIRVKIIRHSERLDYKNPIYWMFCLGQCWADSPLTYNGHQMARTKGPILASDGFNPKVIYTSPYKRTVATATELKHTFSKSQIIIEPLLAEFQDVFKHNIDVYPTGIPTTYDGLETQFSYPESEANFNLRVRFILSRLMEKAKEDFLVVTHGAVVKDCINHFQTLFPNKILDPGNTPYLTTLSFEFDSDTGEIDENTVKLE